MNEREAGIMRAVNEIDVAEKLLNEMPWNGKPGDKGEHLGKCRGMIIGALISIRTAVEGNVRDYGEEVKNPRQDRPGEG